MSGGRPYCPLRFRDALWYMGQHPLRSGRVGLAVVLWRVDFGAYAQLGTSATGATYIKAAVPGALPRPKGLLRSLLHGWRLGGIEHRVRAGRLTLADASWLERQWAGRVPV